VIGTPVQATLWRVAYRYRKAPEDTNSARGAPPPLSQHDKELLARMLPMLGPPPPESGFQGGEVIVVTADASGADLLAVVERAVTLQGVKGTEFALVNVSRMADTVRGLALLEGGAS
jgi:hypothetical protein